MPQTPPQTDTYNTALDIFDRTHPLRVDADENLKVTLSGGSIEIGTVDQGTGGSSPWLITGTVSLTSGSIEIGTVDQGTGGSSPWLIQPQASTTATVTAVSVTTSSTLLLPANSSRKGFSVQCKTSPIYVILGATASTSLYSWYILKTNVLDRTDYLGPVAAVVDSGTATVLVTELT